MAATLYRGFCGDLFTSPSVPRSPLTSSSNDSIHRFMAFPTAITTLSVPRSSPSPPPSNVLVSDYASLPTAITSPSVPQSRFHPPSISEHPEDRLSFARDSFTRPLCRLPSSLHLLEVLTKTQRPFAFGYQALMPLTISLHRPSARFLQSNTTLLDLMLLKLRASSKG
jgi:hypothetical protein